MQYLVKDLPDELVKNIVLKAGGSWGDGTPEDRQFFKRFAAFVAAYEREECVKVCESGVIQTSEWDTSYWNQACENAAFRIRAREEK